jgi:hypothetical protein
MLAVIEQSDPAVSYAYHQSIVSTPIDFAEMRKSN